MTSDRPNEAAQAAAVHRAAHQLFDQPRLYEDPVALRIVGDEAEAALRAGATRAWHEEGAQRDLRAQLAARSRFSEDALAEAVARGVPQYVLLGAGLDTSAVRAAVTYPHLAIYEVDHPAIQACKRQRLAKIGFDRLKALHFAPVDLERVTLAEGLDSAGFDPELPAFFAWLGAVPHLAGEAIEDVLRFIASLPEATEVVFDFIEPSRDPAQAEALRRHLDQFAAAGAPLRTLHEQEPLSQAVMSLNFSFCETIPIADLGDRYFGGQAPIGAGPIRRYVLRALV